MANNQNIEVPSYVIKALKEVRGESLFNMFGAVDVVNRMSELGHYEAFLWMIDMDKFERISRVDVDRTKYMAGLEAMGDVIGLADQLENME